MINISMIFKGATTTARCVFEKNGETRTIEVERDTGAKALGVLVGRLARARLRGQEWSAGDLHGVVPRYPFRRRAGGGVMSLLWIWV